MNETPVETLESTPVPDGVSCRPPAKAEWVSRFLQSGLSLREFCRQHPVALSSLHRWVARHRGQAQEPAPELAQPLFQEVSLSEVLPSGAWAAELAWPDGTILRLGPTIAAQVIEQLWRVC